MCPARERARAWRLAGPPPSLRLVLVAENWCYMASSKGKVLIVDIWGTWCPPCREEIPHFIALYKQYGSQGLEIVGLNKENGSVEAQAQKVREFRDKFGIPYRCAIITERIMAQIPDFDGFPTTLFFDKRGKLRLMYVGYHEARELQAAVENLLAEE